MPNIHIVCLTADGGVPIFTRHLTFSKIDFSTVGSLNGIHMFGRSHGASLRSHRLSDGGVAVWRIYAAKLRLIVLMHNVNHTATDLTPDAARSRRLQHHRPSATTVPPTGSASDDWKPTYTFPLTARCIADLLDLTFGAMVMTVGLNELRSNASADQLKRLLAPSCFGLIDAMLAAALAGDLLRHSECVLSSEGAQHLERLNEFSGRVETAFCVLLVHDKVVVGTEAWWALHHSDRKLLLLATGRLMATAAAKTTGTTVATAAAAATPTPTIDVPVYLPHKSPTVAFRWVCVPVWQHVRVALICGAQPPREDIERLVRAVWSKPERPLVEAAEMSWHCNVPPHMQFALGIAEFVLIDRRLGKFVHAQEVHKTRYARKCAGAQMAGGGGALAVRSALRDFFQHTVDVAEYGLTEEWQSGAATAAGTASKRPSRTGSVTWTNGTQKCQAMGFEEYLLCVLYYFSIPDHIMHQTTEQTLRMLIAEKGTTW